MQIGRRIGIKMVMAMVDGPPQHRFLRRGLRQKGEDELEDAPRRIGFVREQPVVAGRHCEHAQHIERQGQRKRFKRHAGPDRGETAEMDKDEGNGGKPGNLPLFAMGGRVVNLHCESPEIWRRTACGQTRRRTVGMQPE